MSRVERGLDGITSEDLILADKNSKLFADLLRELGPKKDIKETNDYFVSSNGPQKKIGKDGEITTTTYSITVPDPRDSSHEIVITYDPKAPQGKQFKAPEGVSVNVVDGKLQIGVTEVSVGTQIRDAVSRLKLDKDGRLVEDRGEKDLYVAIDIGGLTKRVEQLEKPATEQDKTRSGNVAPSTAASQPGTTVPQPSATQPQPSAGTQTPSTEKPNALERLIGAILSLINGGSPEPVASVPPVAPKQNQQPVPDGAKLGRLAPPPPVAALPVEKISVQK